MECEVAFSAGGPAGICLGVQSGFSTDEANEAFLRRARSHKHAHTHVVYMHVPQEEPDPLSWR
jgi:hypothetical protein